jgi:hypothetical protein
MMIEFIQRDQTVVEVHEDGEPVAAIYTGANHLRILSRHIMIFELDDEAGMAALSVKFQRRS